MNEHAIGDVNGKPLYKNFCSVCVWLGVFGVDSRNADLYYCPQGGESIGHFMGPTVIAQYSDEPGDDSSGLIFAVEKDGMVHPYLQEAARRAVVKGLLPEDWEAQVLRLWPFGGGRRMRAG